MALEPGRPLAQVEAIGRVASTKASGDPVFVIEGTDVCRLDVPASSKPIWTRFKKKDAVLFERRNNSTREVPADEIDAFVAERFGSNSERGTSD